MTQTSHTFQTEVTQLLQLMIHSLYSEREIFLRELVSNASDACDKLRFKALTDHALLAGDEDLKVKVRADTEAGTLTIEDNGIGLTEADAIEHLGTIAKSGTKEFVAGLQDAQKTDVAGMIGQFGVGFYSAFMVADKIVVESRAAGASSDDGVRWESTGDGSYNTESIARPQRGTTITLHLKDDAKEFADGWRLRSLVKKYSDYVGYPIMLPKQPTGDEEKDKAAEGELEQVNSGQALWTRPRADITDEQYKEFYQGACHQWDDPATRIHVNVEGTLEFTLLLFIPSQKPMDLFNGTKSRGLSLYVKRVFIMDDCEELLPEYLRFVRGVVDSDDLPLNVSREILQENAVVTKLRQQITKRVLDHLKKLATSEDDEERKLFATIEDQFGAVLREGLVNDMANKDAIQPLVRYRSTWTETQEPPEDAPALKTSITDYIERMPEGQEKIYYVSAASLAAAKASPHLEGFVKKGYEVLYLVDPVDEWVASNLGEIEGKQLASVAKGAAELGDDDDTKKALEEKQEGYKDFLGFCQESLGDGIKEVRLTARLTDSPCCLVADEGGMSTNMEEMMRRFGQDVPTQSRILELNPEHPLVQSLQQRHGSDSEGLGDYIAVLRDQALLAEGARIADPAAFAKKITAIMTSAVS
ncbi:MAG: molecular chaperone HtpG [Planctomycetota bacterium]|jgi:molecular chaperone HtpG|nr:molecular chaperone HtpG [Planctomycetota bacterium]